MFTPEIIQSIQLIATVLGSGGVIWILSEKNKLLQEQMNAMKLNVESIKVNMDSVKIHVDSMKALLDMIKIDEIEKYYDRRTANAVQDALNNPDIYVVEEIQKLFKSDLASQKLANEVLERQQIMIKYSGVIAGVGNWLKDFPKADRRRIIETNFPENATEIKEFLKLIL